MNDETKPPALPGEVWRNEALVTPRAITVGEDGTVIAWWWSRGRGLWRRDEDGDHYAAAFVHERAVAVAERALRKALSDLWNATTDRDDWKKASACDRLRHAEAALRALGVSP